MSCISHSYFNEINDCFAVAELRQNNVIVHGKTRRMFKWF